jgi:hypothetical protein
LLDVAALASGDWNEAQRTRIVDGYRQALELAGLDPGPAGRMRGDIAGCQLHLAMQWLGWAVDWNPPPEHARDWLREALRLAEELEIA